MKNTIAKFYMDTLWLKMGALRNLKLTHRLFNLAYAVRKSEYMAQILALPVAMAPSTNDLNYFLGIRS